MAEGEPDAVDEEMTDDEDEQGEDVVQTQTPASMTTTTMGTIPPRDTDSPPSMGPRSLPGDIE